MDLSFTGFLGELLENPALLVTTLFTLGVIFVNGWTDAPNAIATFWVTDFVMHLIRDCVKGVAR